MPWYTWTTSVDVKLNSSCEFLKPFVETFAPAALSSIVNEVIRVILNPFVFLRENFTHTKSIKSTKRQTSDLDVLYEHKSDFLPLRCFYEHKKHKKRLSFSEMFFMSIKSKKNIKSTKTHTPFFLYKHNDCKHIEAEIS